MSSVVNRTGDIKSHDILVFSTLRNEANRLPHFFEYYRKLGVNHFLMVDNGSDDGTREYLTNEPDVSLWSTEHSYKASNFGVDWLNYLQMKYGVGHWCLTVDPDELLVYPHCDTRPLSALTEWMDGAGIRTLAAMLIDMYPKGPISQTGFKAGDNPLDTLCWFDAGNYTFKKNGTYQNLWVQGGPRARMFFPTQPRKAPALNKTPLVKWERGFAYISSTHMLLPRGLNIVYDQGGGEKISGALLHTKFLPSFEEKAREEIGRAQHYANSQEYLAYAQANPDDTNFWHTWSERYIGWRQLEVLGLMSKGNWT